MKTLLALLFTFTLISAHYTPSWDNCGDFSPTNIFTPTNVTLKEEPLNEPWALVSACGTVNSNGIATIFHRLEVQQFDGFGEWVHKQLLFQLVPNGSNFCLRNLLQLYDKRDFRVFMIAFDILGNEAACVNMTLKWTDDNPGFLSKRKEELIV